VPLPPDLKMFVDRQVQAGGYEHVSEYIRRLINEDQRRKTREDIDRKLLEALDGAPSSDWSAHDLDSLKRRVIERHPELADEQ